MWAAIVTTVGVVIVALLTRVPALSADARITARIRRDAELLKLAPKGFASDELRRVVEEDVAQLRVLRDTRSERINRRRRLGIGFLGSVLIGLGTGVAVYYRDEWGSTTGGLVVASTAIPALVVIALRSLNAWRELRRVRESVEVRSVRSLTDSADKDQLRSLLELRALLNQMTHSSLDQKRIDEVVKKIRLTGLPTPG